MIVVRGLCLGRIRLLLLVVLLGAAVGLGPGHAPRAHAASVDSPFMLDDADCTGALTTGILALTLGGQFPSGAATVCAVVLSDIVDSTTVGLTIYNSAGTAVSQRPSATGYIDFGGGAYELIWTGLADQAGAGVWPDGAYRTDISLNGTVSASVNWMVGAAPAPVPPTATLAPPTATAVPPTATAVPPTATLVPPTATATPTTTATSTPLPPTATSTNTPHPPTATATQRPLTDAKSLKPAKRGLGVGTIAPDFTLATVNGHRYHLAALRGRPVVLEFFAVWRAQDQREAAVLTRLEAQYLPRNLQVLSILANPYGRAYLTTGSKQAAGSSDVSWFTKTFHVGHPILIDPRFAVVNRYGANDTTLYVLDAKGTIRFIGMGLIPYQTLATAVKAAGVR